MGKGKGRQVFCVKYIPFISVMIFEKIKLKLKLKFFPVHIMKAMEH
jgi:hypothetical protein